MKHLILGTAGHIDHGKTSLVRALTGIDTDRLPEEKARGITIELGFAHLALAVSVAAAPLDGGPPRDNAHNGKDGEHTHSDVHRRTLSRGERTAARVFFHAHHERYVTLPKSGRVSVPSAFNVKPGL